MVDCAWGGRVRTPREGRPRGTSKANNVKINKRRQPTIIRYNLVKVKSFRKSIKTIKQQYLVKIKIKTRPPSFNRKFKVKVTSMEVVLNYSRRCLNYSRRGFEWRLILPAARLFSVFLL